MAGNRINADIIIETQNFLRKLKVIFTNTNNFGMAQANTPESIHQSFIIEVDSFFFVEQSLSLTTMRTTTTTTRNFSLWKTNLTNDF